MKAVATPPDKPTRYVELTDQERDDRIAEEAKDLADQPMREWKSDMESSNAHMSRSVEDIIDALPDNIRESIDSNTLDRYNLKKEIRLRRP